MVRRTCIKVTRDSVILAVNLEQRGETRAVDDRSGDATHLLGLAGLAVECLTLPRLGEDRTAGHRGSGGGSMPGCGSIDVAERVGVYPAKNLACVGEPMVLLWRKHRWPCRTAGCPVQTFTEQRGRRYRRDAKDHAIAGAVTDGRDPAEVARACGVSWPTVQGALVA